MATPQTQYASRVSKVATIKHPVPVLRSGKVNSRDISSYGETRLLPIPQNTGLWGLAQQIYGGNNLQIKERIRVIRQANPGWRNWPGDDVPGGTVILLPAAGRQFVKVPGAQKVIVDKGDGLWHILERHYRTKRGVKLTTAQIERLIPTVATINAIRDLNHELEPGWEIYVPDEAVDMATGTRLCISPRHNTNKPDTPGEFTARIDLEGQLYVQTQGAAINAGTAYYFGDLTMIHDLFRKKMMRIAMKKDAAGRITHITIKGTNRELLKALGLNGTYYRVGSDAFVKAMQAYSKNTGTLILQGATLGTAETAFASAAKNVRKSGLWGAGLTIAIDAGMYVYNGQADQIMTEKFAVRSVNNATNGAISAAAGTLASALTIAGMSAAGASVVPGVGTAVGFVVGLFVGAALSYKNVEWVTESKAKPARR